MIWLFIVSLVWAFSFALIKNHLPEAHSAAYATVRLAFALLVFAPMLRPRATTVFHAALFTGIGVVQFGLMYLLYMTAFGSLAAEEVVLFTVSTPFFVTLVDAALSRRAPSLRWLLAAALAVLAATVILWKRADSEALWRGFLLMQASNLCFAFGQTAYKHLRPRVTGATDASLFGWLMLGGTLSTFLCSFPMGVDWGAFLHATTLSQWTVLAYLGTVASGVCFFLWNRGALQVNAGVLAVFNNLKIPLGVVCSLGAALLLQSHVPSIQQLARIGISLLLILAALRLAMPGRT
ncbi:MAG: EamA family transporter [Puniceicoccales bacterium]|jgi:drug/metabolite transporter (DMT)-like permease|nr:EamA family transporter [Puniceicoccales bacterium]